MRNYKILPEEKKSILILSVIYFLRMTGMFMIVPVISIYGNHIKDTNEFLIGLSIGIYGITQAFFQIPFGLLSDKFNQKILIYIGLIIILIGSTISYICQSIKGIIFGRFLQGIGAISSPIMTLLFDLTREHLHSKVISFIGFSIGLSFLCSIFLSFYIVNHFGIFNVFSLISFLTFVSMILLYFTPNSKKHIFNRETKIIGNDLLKILFKKNIINLNISIFLLHLILMFSFLSIPLKLIAFNVSKFYNYKLYFLSILISFFISPLIISFCEKTKRIKKLFINSIIFIILSEIFIFYNLSEKFFIISGIQIFFISFNILEILIPSLINKICKAGYKGTAMGIYSTSQFFGVALGGILGGYILHNFEINYLFLTIIVLSIFWLFLIKNIPEPIYVSSVRIMIKNDLYNNLNIKNKLYKIKGIISFLIIPEKNVIYLQIDENKVSVKKIKKLLKK
ncbi:MFS transporter [Buchnera aphidicola (Taiwanaphis decaspermi)]|uniref:MFS transporter n=1 Tax=Buchnera aphidicola TaxID=9 RepID=UPI0031B8AAFF